MNIQIPANARLHVERVARVQTAAQENFKKELEGIVPLGYALVVDRSSDLTVYRLNDPKEDINPDDHMFWWSSVGTEVLRKFSSSLFVKESANAEDIFRTCALMQLIVEADIGSMFPKDFYILGKK